MFGPCMDQFSSVIQPCLTLCYPMDCNMPGPSIHHQLLEFMHTHVHWVRDATQPSHPLLTPSPPTFSLAQHQGLFICVSSSHQVAKLLEFSFNICPSNEYSGLIYFRMEWLDLFAVEWTLNSLLHHHGWKASILQRSALFTVQLSHPCMTTGKTIALTRQTVDKVASLLFNMLSKLAINFLPRSKCLLISWLQSPSAVILDTWILVFCSCCNKLPWNGWPKTRPLMVLEGRNLKSSSQKDYITYGGSSLPLPAFGGSRHSLVSLAVLLQFLFPWSHFFLFLCLHLHFSLF